MLTPVTPAAADTTPPTVPTGLAATVISSTQINLSWTASTDNVGVTGYQVFRNGVQIATVATRPTPTAAARPAPPTVHGPRPRRGRQPVALTASVPAATPAPATPRRRRRRPDFRTAITDRASRCPGRPRPTTSASPATRYSATARSSPVAHDLWTAASPPAPPTRTRPPTMRPATSALTLVVTTRPPDTTRRPCRPDSPTTVISVDPDQSRSAGRPRPTTSASPATRCSATACRSPPSPPQTYADSGRTPNTTYQYAVRATDAANNLSALTASVPAARRRRPTPHRQRCQPDLPRR